MGSPINFPNAFTGTGTAVGSQVDANYEAINTWLTSTKIATTYLQAPRSDLTFDFSVDAIAAGATRIYYRKIPAGVTLRAISGQVAVDDLGGAASMTFDVKIGGVSIFAVPPVVVAADAVDERTSFTSSPYDIVAGTTVAFHLTAGAGGTVLNTSACLLGSTLHRS